MDGDMYTEARHFLEALANSIHDREPKGSTLFFFNMAEINVAERWLRNFADEIKKDCVCL